MPFDTRIIDLSSGPVDLAADSDFAGQALFIQNIGRGIVYTAGLSAEPATTADGHKLQPCDIMAIELEAGDNVWVWVRSTGKYSGFSGQASMAKFREIDTQRRRSKTTRPKRYRR